MFCEIVLAPERVHTFYESIRGGDLYLRWYLGITFELVYTEKGEHPVYTLALLMVARETWIDRSKDGSLSKWMPFATQAQMADGQEELVVKKVARRLMIEDYFYQWIDDGEDNHSRRIK